MSTGHPHGEHSNEDVDPTGDSDVGLEEQDATTPVQGQAADGKKPWVVDGVKRNPEWDLGVGNSGTGEQQGGSSDTNPNNTLGEGTGESIWKHKPLAERGHGPVVLTKKPQQHGASDDVSKKA
jgi:hypothetical protein